MIALRDVTVTHGGPPVLDGVTFRLDAGERVCLHGRNGAGKSTLLDTLRGAVEPDRGHVERGATVTVAALSQAVPEGLAGRVYDVVAEGLGPAGAALVEHHAATVALAAHPEDPDALAVLERAQRRVEAGAGWEAHREVERVLTRMGLDPDESVETRSVGMRRRVLLARALVMKPDVLLLDEPTNHLDVDAIAWLEGVLSQFAGALLFVTHDRALTRRLATRIVELEHGVLHEYDGDYDAFLVEREHRRRVDARHRAAFDKKLAEEETWIRQGVKERRTRNEGRVRALMDMRRARASRRDDPGRIRASAEQAGRTGRIVMDAVGLTVALGGRTIFAPCDLRIERGDKVGIVGPNGAGKTTLVRALLGEIAPTGGEVEHGTNLEVGYFDQLHASLDWDKTVFDNVADGSDRIVIDGTSRHVIGYLQSFLFPPERARSPIRHLSGGERNRLLLAKLFARPSNVLVLDEPTNDLDLETLELLEEQLLEYGGAVLVVSHDRELLDRVATSIVDVRDGVVREIVGGWADYERQRAAAVRPEARTERAAKPAPKAAPARRRLTYAEKRELEELPQRIESLEADQAALHAQMADPAFFRGAADTIAAATARLKTLESDILAAYARWEALEARA